MPLDMRSSCERCGEILSPRGEAYICANECTFCGKCAKSTGHTCPNCAGELVRRPRAEE
jgi:uncharacterized protein